MVPIWDAKMMKRELPLTMLPRLTRLRIFVGMVWEKSEVCDACFDGLEK